MANGHGGRRPGAGAPRKRVNIKDLAAQTRDAEAQERASRAAAGRGREPTGSGASIEAVRTLDAFVNYANNLGVGADNILTTSSASFAPLTRIRTVLEWMYRGQFICKNAVDVVANDMTRQGVTIRGEMDPTDIEALSSEATAKAIWLRINETIKWARLYGGCLAFMIVDGQDPATPLRLETVGRDQFKGLLVLDRWMVEPSLERLVTDPNSTDLGLPMFYRITADAPALPRLLIHHTRVLRLEGSSLPYWQKLQENLWGLSVYETIQDRITAFDLATTGAAQLVNKAYIRTYKIKGLREIIAAGSQQGLNGLSQFMDLMRRYQGIEGVTIIDGEDEFEGHEHGTFAGLAEIIDAFATQLSGGLGIPKTKLFGESPGGLNATGESDMRNYYDLIRAQQMATLQVPITTIYRLMAQSLGIQVPEDFAIEFNPLWQLSEEEKARSASEITNAVLAASSAGVISDQITLKELRQQSTITGVFTSITDEDIEAADDVAAPPPAPLGPDGQPLDPSAAPGERGGPGEAFGKANVERDPRAQPSAVKPGPGAEPDAPGEDIKGGRSQDAAFGPVTLNVWGMPIHIETFAGQSRRGVDRFTGQPWEAIMRADYGYFIGTSSAEGPTEGMDCFVGGDYASPTVFVIDQVDPASGAFDEHKVVVGVRTLHEALDLYTRSWSDDTAMRHVAAITPLSWARFQEWLREGDVTKPYCPRVR